MFSGIIEELGIVTSLIRGLQSAKLALSVSKNFTALKVGESIAVNGVCLTVANIRKNSLEFDVSPESLKRSNLQYLKIGDKVNLERALLLSGRLGGHIVTGHVDGVGEIRSKILRDKHVEFQVSVPSKLLNYFVPKGSITIDGISLTVSDVKNLLLIVNIIPHTAKTTTLGDLDVGDRVNIEVDILSKYIERHLKREAGNINEETLSRVGFFPMGWIDN
ncbi:MAG: riboflavin synthase [Candidatus Margulisiibacteriota bacterium]|nr:riboflavin synthase [Candidatus Margulisiibacteriota bacterium]